MKLRDIVDLRDKLKSELQVVEKFLEIAKSRGVNGEVHPAAPRTTTSKAAPRAEQAPLAIKEEGSYGGITAKVKQGIELCGDTYTARDVFNALEKEGKPLKIDQVTTVLTRLADDTKEIFIKTRGKGSKGTVYMKDPLDILK